jgi:uracil phosphoribosyltransferase
MYRDPISLQAIEYYSRLPDTLTVDRIFILDPMVATGNTAIAALKMMKEWGLPMDKVSFLGVIASRKALEGIEKVFPDVQVGSCFLHFFAP